MSAVLQAIHHHAARNPARAALIHPQGGMTYAALSQAIDTYGLQLLRQKPQAVGIAINDPLAWAVLHLASVSAGIPQIPIPPFFTPEQRTHALRDAGADLLLTSAPDGEWHIGSHGVALASLANAAVTLPAHTAMVTYTSGSTGTPKGVCLSQQGMETVAQSLLSVLGTDTAQRHLSVLPLAVLLEQIGGLYTSLLAGGSYVIAPLAQGLAPALHDSRATSCILVPELLKQLLDQCEHAPAEFPELRFAAVGGARVAEELLTRAHALGLPVYQGYGLTESASVVAVNTPTHHHAHSVGKLLPHIRLTLTVEGEIILQNPAILGYTGGTQWQGDYATGDLGSLDDNGYLILEGRKKNLLITSYGRNVAPEWPESLLTAQPEIAQAMVYGDGDASLSALLVPATATVTTHQLEQAIMRVNASLPDYARIGRWRICEPFTPARGLLTGTGRIKRDAILHWLTTQKETTHDLLRPACA